MRKLALAVAIVSLGAVALIATAIAKNGNGGGRDFSAKLVGYNEVPSNSTTGHGRFRARVLGNPDRIEYTLKYEDLEGPVTPVTNTASGQAHIHFGQWFANGGISAFLCGGGDKPVCPAGPDGEVSGTIDAADVIGPAGQGIAAGEFSELIRAMRRGLTYANVHTTKFPNGEIRGQLDRGRHHGWGKGKGKDDDD
jgi:CHRD domain-containing protein